VNDGAVDHLAEVFGIFGRFDVGEAHSEILKMHFTQII